MSLGVAQLKAQRIKIVIPRPPASKLSTKHDKKSPNKKKQFSKSFIDLLVINTIIPVRFAYAKSLGKETTEEILELMQSIKPEKNIIIEKFSNFGIKAHNAFETQSLLQLKNEYCNHGKCLQCSIGTQLLKQ
jgi:hypothetical protein